METFNEYLKFFQDQLVHCDWRYLESLIDDYKIDDSEVFNLFCMEYGHNTLSIINDCMNEVHESSRHNDGNLEITYKNLFKFILEKKFMEEDFYN
jgi:hypothetical protein